MKYSYLGLTVQATVIICLSLCYYDQGPHREFEEISRRTRCIAAIKDTAESLPSIWLPVSKAFPHAINQSLYESKIICFINWVDNVNWPPQRDSKGLTFETSASESLYGGQFTLSTQLMKPNYPEIYGCLFSVQSQKCSSLLMNVFSTFPF